MTLPARLALLLLPCLLPGLLPACGDSGGAGEAGSSTAPATTTTEATSTSTGQPTPTTSGDASSSTGAPPSDSCIYIKDEAACAMEPDCTWKGVVQYTYGAQGCGGSVANFCVDKTPAGATSAWYREVDGDAQVLEFGYTPDDLGPDWQPCTCDGPLACLCTSVTEACPDRLEEFCAVNITELGCSNATYKGDPVCHTFKVAPEGPVDDKCEVKQAKTKCLPATDTDKNTCEKLTFDYPACNGQMVDPVYWRDNMGTIELIQSCGPVPTGFTACEAMDTPEQPDECGLCVCL